MADPATGNITTPQAGTQNPNNWGTQLALNDPTIGTNIGGGSTGGTNGWLSTIESAIPAGIALTQAGQATRAGQNLTNAISGAAAPQLNLGTATVGQLQGKGTVGGPMGAYISGATGAANELAQTAGQYATGNLTPAQQQQVQSFSAGQKAQVAGGLSRTGNLDSSTRAALNQEVDNNAAMLTQSLVNQNLQMAGSALQAATGTYNSILQTSLSQSTLGSQATAIAVAEQLKNDQQVSQIIQQILAGISMQATTAAGGQVSKQGGNTPGQQLGAGVGQMLQKLGIGGNNPMSNVPTGGVPSDLQSQFQQEQQGYLASGSAGADPWSAPAANAPQLDISSFQPPDINIDTSGATTDVST